MDNYLLDILCCPLTKEPLRLLRRDELDALNRLIETGNVANVGGNAIALRFSTGLITRNGQKIYRIDDGIPVLLGDEGIASAQVIGFPN